MTNTSKVHIIPFSMLYESHEMSTIHPLGVFFIYKSQKKNPEKMVAVWGTTARKTATATENDKKPQPQLGV